MEKSFYEIWKLGINLVKTKLFFPRARIIRFPLDMRGKKYIKYGEKFTTGTGCRIEAYRISDVIPEMIIGNNVQINDYVHLACGESLIIEDDVLIASKVYISDINHGNYSGDNQSSPEEKAKDRQLSTNPVKIERNVWIGENVAILPGITIGRNSIVGSNAVVTKDIPEDSIAVGNPAKVIKRYNYKTEKWEKEEQGASNE